MVELHIDDIPDNPLLTKIPSMYRFGGNLSVRKQEDEWPMFSFSHTECIFHQYIFTGKAWKGPKGKLAVIPKDEISTEKM
jgi:hypothetical protein